MDSSVTDTERKATLSMWAELEPGLRSTVDDSPTTLQANCCSTVYILLAEWPTGLPLGEDAGTSSANFP